MFLHTRADHMWRALVWRHETWMHGRVSMLAASGQSPQTLPRTLEPKRLEDLAAASNLAAVDTLGLAR